MQTPRSVDVGSDVGITYVQRTIDVPDLGAVLEVSSGGPAAGDYDADGWVELYVTRLDNTDILCRNPGDDPEGAHLGFEDVFTQALLTDNLASNGAAWGEIDNHGDLDLYVTTVGDTRFYLYIKLGQGQFTEFFNYFRTHATILLSPAIVGLLRDRNLSADFRDALAFADQNNGLS